MATVFPQGAIHFEINMNCEPAMFIAAFNNEVRIQWHKKKSKEQGSNREKHVKIENQENLVQPIF
jgi:hypothetical protein